MIPDYHISAHSAVFFPSVFMDPGIYLPMPIYFTLVALTKIGHLTIIFMTSGLKSSETFQVGKFIQLTATFTGGIVVAFFKGWLLTLIMLSSIPLLVFSGAVLSITVGKLASRGQAAYSLAAAVAEQTIGSIRTVQEHQYTLSTFTLLCDSLSVILKI